ncbi:MAG: trigger factor, partial [Alphaproteobacteria bacterium]|nr:trigger factor [Alphaproteobacteria bacterium]
MQVTETLSDGLKREFQVVIPAADIDGKVTGRLNELAPTLRIPGFRPGKVPSKLLKQRYGQAVLGEVLEAAVNETSQATLAERGLRPAMQPKIEITDFDEGKDLAFSLTVELLPEIKPVDFSTVTLERLTAEPGDAEIDEAVTRLSDQHKSSEPITDDRASQNGDVVVIDFKGTVDGEAFEGGTAEGHQLELGSNQFLTGFEDQLIGKKAGESIEVKVAFPDDYGQPDLAGKDACFETKIIEIREPKLVEINDDFAKLFGMDDMAALKAAMSTQIEQEFAQASRARLKRALLDHLEQGEAFEVPTGMADQEYEAICRAVNPDAPAAAQGHDHDHDHDHD